MIDLRKCDYVFASMREAGLPLLLRGEVTGEDVDVFDRENAYIEKRLIPLVTRFLKLRIMLERITTANAAKVVSAASDKVAATITLQHLR